MICTWYVGIVHTAAAAAPAELVVWRYDIFQEQQTTPEPPNRGSHIVSLNRVHQRRNDRQEGQNH